MKTIPNLRLPQLTLGVLALFTCLQASSATFTLNPAIDALVTTGSAGNLSGNNYGGAGALSVAAPNLAQGEFQSVLQFGLAGAKSSFDAQFGAGQWTIQSVTLQLTAIPPNNGIFNAAAAGQFAISFMQNDGWTEGSGTPAAPTTIGITFSTLSNFVGVADENLGTFGYNGVTSGNSTYSLGLTPAFTTDLLAGSAVSLRMFAVDTAVSYLSDSRSFGTGSARPLLTITAVPEPASVALLLLGLGGAAARWSNFRARRG